MKKIMLVLLAGISLASAQAQVQFGVKAGANFSSITNGAGTLAGFNGGVLVDLPLAGRLSLQPEAVYSMQGTKYNGNKTNLNYINIPVLLKYKLPVGVFFQTGPQFGILTSAKNKEVGEESVNIKSLVKSTDFGWSFGAGYMIPGVNLGIDLRYNLGLTKINKEISGINTDEKNKSFQVGIFYLFGGASGKSKE